MPGVDVLLVSLGSTAGLRAADEELLGGLERAGAAVAMAVAARPRELRTLALVDLAWARAARAAAKRGIAEHEPRAVIYSTTTAALLWPRPGAIRFDALSAVNRPGRHGLWQRPVEARALRAATLLLPWGAASLEGAPQERAADVVVPVPVAPSGPLDGPRDVAAVTYGAGASKKGLDRVLAAWASVRREGEELVVAGASPEVIGGELALSGSVGVRVTGPLPREEYRALLRRARVYVTAPRREDYGIAQLEALADGCRLVTTPAPGPYAALPLARALEPRYVPGGPEGLAAALRAALDDTDGTYAARAREAVAPWAPAAVDALVASRVLPALLP